MRGLGKRLSCWTGLCAADWLVPLITAEQEIYWPYLAIGQVQINFKPRFMNLSGRLARMTQSRRFNKENSNNGIESDLGCCSPLPTERGIGLMGLIFICHEESTKMPIFVAASIKLEFGRGSRKFWAACVELRNHTGQSILVDCKQNNLGFKSKECS